MTLIQNTKIKSANDLLLLFLFLLWLQLYPNITFEYSYLKHLIYYPLVIITPIILFIVGFSAHYKYIKPLLPLLLLIGLYSLHTFKFVPSYLYMWLITLFFSGFFSRRPSSINQFLLAYAYLTILLSIHAIFVIFLHSTGMNLSLAYDVEKLNIANNMGFNLFFGVIGSFDGYYRLTSYFTESNRFAYFLLPFFFILLFTQDIKYRKSLLCLISLTLLWTMSYFACFATLATTLFLKASKRIILWTIAFLFFIGCLILTLGTDNEMFNKSSSYTDRMSSLHNAIAVFEAFPFGIPRGMELIEVDGVNGEDLFTAPLFYLSYAGIQGLCMLLLFLLIMTNKVRYIIKNGSGLQQGFAMGFFAYSLCQAFLGVFFEFLYSAFVAIILVWHSQIKNEQKQTSLPQANDSLSK